jgi:hypothetical protein
MLVLTQPVISGKLNSGSGYAVCVSLACSCR